MIVNKDGNRVHPPPRLADQLTMQGVKQIADVTSGRLRRSFWFLVVCGGLTFSAFNIAKQVQLYLSVPVNVDIDVKLAQTLQFPTVTVCNTNMFKKSEIDKLNLTGALKEAFIYDFQERVKFDDTNYDFSAVDDYSIETAMFKYGLDVNDSVIQCDWMQQECDATHLTETKTEIGVCFSFNVNGSTPTVGSGRHYGLHLLLDAQSEEFTRSRENTEGPGFMIAVHSPDVPLLMNDIGMALSPGSQYFYGVELATTTSPKGMDQCGSKRLKYYNKPYSREACRIECLTEYALEQCSCRDIYMPGNGKQCSALKGLQCLVPAMYRYPSTLRECESSCPQTCSYTTFNVRSSSSLRMTQEYLSTLASATNKTPDYWRSNYVAVDVYLSSMTYQSIEKRYGYSVLELFCDIGGALSLVLGASVVTGVELIDFAVHRLCAYWCYKSNTKRINVKPSQ
ncbi:acid-sensing ion channel 2-like [Haliotis rufescens]|uniref:acid-sensing ion channel 2-like n=1 Tax=Haliotis rufescens TaxID=6454 RepID=UPI00201EAE87|nr:acid-sensing ion channel 2-like [Haliotis rufescens]